MRTLCTKQAFLTASTKIIWNCAIERGSCAVLSFLPKRRLDTLAGFLYVPARVLHAAINRRSESKAF